MICIRLFTPEDRDTVARLFHETVREVNSQHYTPDQVRAWAPEDMYFRDWQTICTENITYIAELVQQEPTIVGFAELERNGRIAMFYVHKNHQRQGVGKALYAAIRKRAEELQLDRLYTEASITARSFFERMGFCIITAQTVVCRSEFFLNYKMEILL